MVEEIFVNLPIKDLEKSMAFFSKLGFTFNPDFTDKNAACMKIGKNIFAMLIVESVFKTFTKKSICDAMKSTETILALSVKSRKEVDEIYQKAIKSGGKKGNDPSDHGWMYVLSFQDLDGHMWEVFHMDEKLRAESSKKV